MAGFTFAGFPQVCVGVAEGWYLCGEALQKRFWMPFTSALVSSSESEGLLPRRNLRADHRVTPAASCLLGSLGSGWSSSPVQAALAVLKLILLSVFSKHSGPHRLEHATVQQGLAHTHHCGPRHTPGTYGFTQTIVC